MKVNINKYQMGEGLHPLPLFFGQYVRGEEHLNKNQQKLKNLRLKE